MTLPTDGVRGVVVVAVAYRDPATLLSAADAAYGAATPVAVFDTARPGGGHRWSFLAADPLAVDAGGRGPDAFGRLQIALAADRARPTVLDLSGAGGIVPPFVAGVVGRLGYELVRGIEPVSAVPPGAADAGVDDWCLFAPGVVVAADVVACRAWLCATGIGADAPAALALARARADDARRLFGLAAEVVVEPGSVPTGETPRRAIPAPPAPTLEALAAAGLTATMSRDAYLAAIGAVQDAIGRGDVYEVCLSQRFALSGPAADPVAVPGARLFAALRAASPAPMGAYLRCGGVDVASTSPERFVRVGADGWVATEPIKGTRPRGRTPADDAAAAAELRASGKDAAEHLMIVDLARNDLGRVARYGSVRVPSLARLERHAFTHQLVSTVRARLAPGRTVGDLLAAAFAPGSMTGAPKVAAMQMIARLEPCRRGPFAGAIGWFGHDGAADLSVVIRSVVRTPVAASLHVGGAIVADSDPAAEYQETLDKAVGVAAGLRAAVGADGVPAPSAER